MTSSAFVGLNCNNRTKISHILHEDLRIIMAVSHHLRDEYKKSTWKITWTKHDATKMQLICEKQTSFFTNILLETFHPLGSYAALIRT